jgi:hypothetical protein
MSLPVLAGRTSIGFLMDAAAARTSATKGSVIGHFGSTSAPMCDEGLGDRPFRVDECADAHGARQQFE